MFTRHGAGCLQGVYSPGVGLGRLAHSNKKV